MPSAANDSSGAFLFGFLVCGTRLKKATRSSPCVHDVWCAFRRLLTKCPRRSQAPCSLSVLNISPRLPPARNRDRFPPQAASRIFFLLLCEERSSGRLNY